MTKKGQENKKKTSGSLFFKDMLVIGLIFLAPLLVIIGVQSGRVSGVVIVFLSVLAIILISVIVYVVSKLNNTKAENQKDKEKKEVAKEEKKVVKTENNSKRLPFKSNNAVLRSTITAIVVLSIFPLLGLLCLWIQSHEAVVTKFLH